MTDIVLVPVTGGNNTSAMNSNFDKIEDAVNNDILHLEGGNNVMKQDIDMNGNSFLNYDTDVNDPDSLISVGEADSRYYNVSGDTLAGNMNAAGNKILNLPVATAPHEPMRKNEADAANAAQDATIADNKNKSLRVNDNIQAMAENAAARKDKLLSFDNAGNPVAIAAANQSATDLELRLRDAVNPLNGAAIVGWERDQLSTGIATVHGMLDGQLINVWEFVNLITDMPNPNDPTTWDWAPAINGMYAYIAANYPQAGLRYGAAAFFPGGRYPIKSMVGPKRIGIATYGEGPLTSVIEYASGFVGSWLFQSRHENPGGNMGGGSLYNIGFDCKGASVGGVNMVDPYDGVEIDNIRISDVHADFAGLQINPERQTICQTVTARNIFAYKNGAAATVPTIRLIKVQEAQFIGCKSWAGGFGGAGRGNTSAWYLEDCRSIDLLGCSAVGAEIYGVHVHADTKQMSGIRLRGMLYENCNGLTKTTSTNSATFPILTFVHDLARTESPIAGGYSFGGLSGARIDVGVINATLEADSTQVDILAQRLSNVTNLGTRNTVRSHANAIDNFYGLSVPPRVVVSSTPRYTFGVNSITDFSYLEWSRSGAANNGLRLGVNTGSDITLASFKEGPASGNTAMLLLCNDGATTTVRQVSVGAADSGGAGFRVLRVPN